MKLAREHGSVSCSGSVFGLSVCARRITASGAGRRPASHARNVSNAMPSAVAYSDWESPRRVRISRKTEVLMPSDCADATRY